MRTLFDLTSQFRNPLFQQQHSFFSSRKHTKPTFINLPVLNGLIESSLSQVKKPPLEKTAIFYVHHALQTSVNLMDGILKLGAKPQNVFVLDKHYSKCPEVVQQITDFGVFYQPCSAQTSLGGFTQSFIRDINWLWWKLSQSIGSDVEEILILDHGGHALSYIPYPLLEKYKVIGVEKTTGGLINLDKQKSLPPFPIIGVANCAAKKTLESPLIAEAVVDKLLPYFPLTSENLTCAVVGYGSIGQAIAEKLLSLGHRVIICDKDTEQLRTAKTKNGISVTSELASTLAFADYIFGCSGQDITAASLELFRLCPKDKTLISCSSEDKEFLSLIQTVPQDRDKQKPVSPLSNLQYKTDLGATINILNGGFPVNFDSSGESVPANDIQLTRALVLAGVLQASQFFEKYDVLGKTGIYTLDPKLQMSIANAWFPTQPMGRFPDHVVQNFHDKEWIVNNSGGIYDPFETNEEIQIPSFKCN